MIRISQGKIRLENKVIDLSQFEVRPKVTEEDLEKYYDSFVNHAGEIGDYFEDRGAFDKAMSDATKDKRPKLVVRETKYPFMWGFRTSFMPFDFLKPSTRRLHDDYFMVAHCITKIPSKKKIQEGEVQKPLDEKLRDDISEKFKQYPEYEGIIEIPNDRTQPETKSTTFHESLHYLIIRYQAETGRDFINAFIREDLAPLEKYQAESIIHERAVEILTDKLLAHDPDAQFENRWLHYSLNDGFRHLTMGVSAIATGVLIGTSISHPYLLPFALVPNRIRDYANIKHKKSKREELLKPIEYPQFKI
jgi:hypothetical protein